MNNDLISRSALKKDIEENSIILEGVRAIEVDCVKVLIDNAPTVTPKQGKWRVYEGTITCEECGTEVDEITPFCAWCGADMREGGVNE